MNFQVDKKRKSVEYRDTVLAGLKLFEKMDLH